MNTARRTVKVRQCVKCPFVFVTAGNTSIGLAHPRPVSVDFATGMPLEGTCPNHARKDDES